MKNSLIITAIVAALSAPAAAALDLGAEDALATQRFLVGFYGDPGYEAGDSYHGERVVAVDNDLDFIVVETANPDLLAAKAALDESTRYVESDASDHQLLLTPNDALYGDAGHYGTKITKIELGWDATVGTTAVKLSVIDSGINKAHEDAGGARILQGYDFKDGDSNPDDTRGCSYHGSHTAGTSAATLGNGKGIAGVAQVTINPLKIFSKGFFGCGTTTTAIVNAFKYTADQGDHVSTNSWGGGSASTAINDAITYAAGKGVIIVGAAGNSGPCTNCVGEPWKSNGHQTIVVSSSDSSDKFSSFSSEGPQVDIIAPGSSILSVDGGSTSGYKKLSGTSMATPHVAGVAALIETLYPGLSFADVEARLKGSADNLGLSSDKQGAGRLDGQGALA